MTTQGLCKCGCGQAVVEGNRFRRGHYARTPAAKRMYKKHRMRIPPPNPSGKCQCGCGQTTKKFKRNRKERGEAIGQHHRFLPGHATMPGPGAGPGKSNPRWKGGRFTNGYGYIEILSPDHPHKNIKGYVLEHRLVMEKKLGRCLDPEERVHHINGERTDNRVKNLVVITRSDHAKIHAEALAKWRKEDPERFRRHSREAGLKGAAAKWGNRKN